MGTIRRAPWPDAPTALRVGERPPAFTLPDAAGRPVSLADYRGKKPVVLVFYRDDVLRAVRAL